MPGAPSSNPVQTPCACACHVSEHERVQQYLVPDWPHSAGRSAVEIGGECDDTAPSTNPVAMGALRNVVPGSQIVYGTDYSSRSAQETARGLTTNGVFTTRALEAINRGNALRILPRYR